MKANAVAGWHRGVYDTPVRTRATGGCHCTLSMANFTSPITGVWLWFWFDYSTLPLIDHCCRRQSLLFYNCTERNRESYWGQYYFFFFYLICILSSFHRSTDIFYSRQMVRLNQKWLSIGMKLLCAELFGLADGFEFEFKRITILYIFCGRKEFVYRPNHIFKQNNVFLVDWMNL